MTRGPQRPALIAGLKACTTNVRANDGGWRSRSSCPRPTVGSPVVHLRVARFGGQPSREGWLASRSSLAKLESEGWSGKRDSNPRLRPWQGRTLPLSYSRPTSQSTTRPGWLSSVDVSTDARLKPSRPWFSLSDRCRTQHLRRLLRRRRVDGETRSPVEAGHPCQLRHDLEVPVIVVAGLVRKRRRVHDQ